MSDPLEVELQMVVNPHVVAGNWIWVLGKSNKCSQSMSHLPGSLLVWFGLVLTLCLSNGQDEEEQFYCLWVLDPLIYIMCLVYPSGLKLHKYWGGPWITDLLPPLPWCWNPRHVSLCLGLCCSCVPSKHAARGTTSSVLPNPETLWSPKLSTDVLVFCEVWKRTGQDWPSHCQP